MRVDLPLQTLLKWLLAGATVYVAIVALMYVAQRKLMYFPDTTRYKPASVGLPAAEEVVLDGEQAHQIANVLRLGPGDQIMLVRNDVESLVAIQSVDAGQVRGRCLSKRAVATEPRVRLTVALPILRGDRTEEVIEAVTQLGVSRIVPFVSSRSVVRSLPDAKRARWNRVAREAAETARRGRIPTIDEPREWERLFDALMPRSSSRGRARCSDAARCPTDCGAALAGDRSRGRPLDGGNRAGQGARGGHGRLGRGTFEANSGDRRRRTGDGDPRSLDRHQSALWSSLRSKRARLMSTRATGAPVARSSRTPAVSGAAHKDDAPRPARTVGVTPSCSQITAENTPYDRRFAIGRRRLGLGRTLMRSTAATITGIHAMKNAMKSAASSNPHAVAFARPPSN